MRSLPSSYAPNFVADVSIEYKNEHGEFETKQLTAFTETLAKLDTSVQLNDLSEDDLGEKLLELSDFSLTYNASDKIISEIKIISEDELEESLLEITDASTANTPENDAISDMELVTIASELV